MDDKKAWIVGLTDGRLLMCESGQSAAELGGSDHGARGECRSVHVVGGLVVAGFQNGEILVADIDSRKVNVV